MDPQQIAYADHGLIACVIQDHKSGAVQPEQRPPTYAIPVPAPNPPREPVMRRRGGRRGAP